MSPIPDDRCRREKVNDKKVLPAAVASPPPCKERDPRIDPLLEHQLQKVLPAAGVSPEPVDKKRTIAQRLFDATFAQGEIEESLKIDFDHLGWDYYDGSLEIYEVAPEARLDAAELAMLKEAGFDQVYVNHIDKWETHYGLSGDGPWKPWRVSYPHKRGDGGAIWLEEIPTSWTAVANVEVVPQGASDDATPQAKKGL